MIIISYLCTILIATFSAIIVCTAEVARSTTISTIYILRMTSEMHELYYHSSSSSTIILVL